MSVPIDAADQEFLQILRKAAISLANSTVNLNRKHTQVANGFTTSVRCLIAAILKPNAHRCLAGRFTDLVDAHHFCDATLAADLNVNNPHSRALNLGLVLLFIRHRLSQRRSALEMHPWSLDAAPGPDSSIAVLPRPRLHQSSGRTA